MLPFRTASIGLAKVEPSYLMLSYGGETVKLVLPIRLLLKCDCLGILTRQELIVPVTTMATEALYPRPGGWLGAQSVNCC